MATGDPPQPTVCPHCWHCSHCGKSNLPVYPLTYPIYPTHWPPPTTYPWDHIIY